MADEPQANATQADAEATPQAGTESQHQPETTRADAPTNDGGLSREEARKLRNEASSLRKRLKDLEDAQLSESEKLKRDFEATAAERDELRQTLRSMRAEAAARDAGAVYPDLVAGRIDPEAIDDPKALSRAMTDLKAQYPSLFRSQNGSVDAGARGDVVATRDMNQLIRRAAGHSV